MNLFPYEPTRNLLPFDGIVKGTTKIALPWTKELRTLKSLVEGEVGCLFNSCLCNLYHDGNEGITYDI